MTHHPPPKKFFDERRSRSGLTLMELLVVIGLIVIILGISIPAMMNLNRAEGLNHGARQFSNILQLARQDAITNGRRVRVIMLGSISGVVNASADFEKMYRGYRVIAKTSGTLSDTNSLAWSFIERWEYLPTGVVFEAGSLNTLPTTSPLTLTSAASSLSVAATFNYIEFKPSGRFNSLSPGTLTLREGFVSGSGASANTSFTNAVNKADVNVDNLSGRIRVVRPGD